MSPAHVLGVLSQHKRLTFFNALSCGLLVTLSLFILHPAASRSAFKYPNSLSSVAATVLPVCPSPHDVLAGTRALLNHDAQSCQILPSAHPEFQSSLCHDPDVCNSFTFRVKRVDAAVCMAVKKELQPSNEPALNQFIKTQRGPDAFFIRTDGAQRYATTWSTFEEESCSYSFDVRINNPGRLYLEAWHTFEVSQRYEGFSETNASWPEMKHTPLLTGPVSLSICGSHCKPFEVPLTDPNRTLINYPLTETALFESPTLPACSGLDPIRGSYLPTHLLDRLSPPYAFTHEGKPVNGRYHFVPSNCEWKHAGTRFGPVSRCTTTGKKRVLFIGDSHGRVAYDGVVHRLQGNQWPMFESEKAGSKIATIGDVNFEFRWDPRARLLWDAQDCNIFDDSTVAFVFSAGAHWAIDSNTTHFSETISESFQQAVNCPKAPKTLIYLTSPAQPPRQDDYVKKYTDHRTNIRLHHWSDVATRLARDAGFMVVDQFDLSMPHVEEPMKTDFAHYVYTDAMDPIVDDVIGKLGICPLV